jgi:Glucosidase II beta subunit-like protein
MRVCMCAYVCITAFRKKWTKQLKLKGEDFEMLQQAVQTAVSLGDRTRVNALYDEMRQAQQKAMALHRTLSMPHMAGFNDELIALLGKCYRTTWSKIRVGEFGVEGFDEYVMEVCPFMNATQYTRDVYNKVRSNQQLNADDINSMWSLGSFQQWGTPEGDDAMSVTQIAQAAEAARLSDTDVPAMTQQQLNIAYATMQMTEGEQCWQGPKRSMTVTLRCGPKNRLIDVEENGKCTYEAVLETYLVCRPAALEELQQLVQRQQRTIHQSEDQIQSHQLTCDHQGHCTL